MQISTRAPSDAAVTEMGICTMGALTSILGPSSEPVHGMIHLIT